MFSGHDRDFTIAAGELPTRTRRSDEFQIPFSQRNLVDNSPANQCSHELLPTKISDVPFFPVEGAGVHDFLCMAGQQGKKEGENDGETANVFSTSVNFGG